MCSLSESSSKEDSLFGNKLIIKGGNMMWNESIELTKNANIEAQNVCSSFTAKWSIKDGVSNFNILSCVRKEYFFILVDNRFFN